VTFGSLFAGIGGFDLGFERAGMTCKWQVEIDPFCRAVLAKHWPDVPRYEDVRDVHAVRCCPLIGLQDAMACGNCLLPVDVLCGGFPCQDISVAGRGEGLAGERSGLWFEYARLIRELRPRYVVVENVTALLGRGLGRVLGDLAASGYNAEWDCIPASAVGAPHQRDRVWIVAYADRRGRRPIGECIELVAVGVRREDDPGSSTQSGARVASPAGVQLSEQSSSWLDNSRYQSARALPGEEQVLAVAESDRRKQGRQDAGEDVRVFSGKCGDGCRHWAVEPEVGRVAHGVPRRVDRLRGLGNAVVPQITQWIGERLMEASQ
jgi:DNA (cytosine-5)-methyltransferase 1